jgi:hypothetical protein
MLRAGRKEWTNVRKCSSIPVRTPTEVKTSCGECECRGIFNNIARYASCMIPCTYLSMAISGRSIVFKAEKCDKSPTNYVNVSTAFIYGLSTSILVGSRIPTIYLFNISSIMICVAFCDGWMTPRWVRGN